MTWHDDDIDPALFALGTLSGEARAEAQRRADVDPAFAAQVADWETLLAPMAYFCTAVDAPADLLAKIEARLDAASRRTLSIKTIRADEGRWFEIAPGVRIKSLNKMREAKRQTILLDVSPGAVYGGHTHDEDEEIFVISGDLTFGEFELGPGDYHLAAKGTRHPPVTTRQGCRCLIVCAI